MLESLINEVKEYDYVVIDDGSSFKLSKNFHQFEHGGKSKFWEKWLFGLLNNNKINIRTISTYRLKAIQTF